MRRTVSIFVLLGVCLAACTSQSLAQSFVENHQDSTRYNLASTNGLPISDVADPATGSDGRAPGANPGPLATVRQFRGAITFGALVVPKPVAWDSGLTFGANAESTDLPRAKVGSETRVVMLRARVGSPYLSRRVSYLFGAVIPVPEVDEYGVPLKSSNTIPDPDRLPIEPDRYWAAEPYSATGHSNRGYYWSPNAGRVFAISPGPLEIVWRKAVPSSPVGSPPDVATVTIAGSTYTIFTNRYIISGSAVKHPRQIYWTEGDFVKTGKRVSVPTARVGGLQIVYNNTFPERVENAYPMGSTIEPDATNRLDETRTLWFDQSIGSINAYNVEGRVFVEVLGDLREDRQARHHLGFEIVDVRREPTPHDVAIELGERLTAYPAGNPDDANLFPEPIPNPAQTFAHQHNINGTERVHYFAIRKTSNLNDLQVHWMEEGLAGLKWPFRFVRYELDWPTDVAKYSHYVRPLVATESEARATAVPLPNQNAPIIQYQDPLDQVRGKLTEEFEYFTFLTPDFPAHRALIRFSSGEHIRFERVFSWLDTTLRSGSFEKSVANELSSWTNDVPGGRFDWPDNMITPRVVTGIIEVGSRVPTPLGEIGGGLDDDYVAGHIIQETGDSFSPTAYKDPFTEGFEAANLGAIIPVNAIPGDNLLDVMWFRKNQVDEGKNFTNILWPSIIARYTIQWPTGTSEIVLASNDGTGPLPSLQANGTIYYQNDPTLPGYNPNEEHALIQGGQAYALRDDLNITTPNGYSSEPCVLLDYTEDDGRPAMRVFKVLREKPEQGVTFNFNVNAGTILQPPMPLPLMEKPFAPKLAGQQLRSVNTESSSWAVTASSAATIDGIEIVTLTLESTPVFPSHQMLILQNGISNPREFFVIAVNAGTRMVSGIAAQLSLTIEPWTVSPQPADTRQWKYAYNVGPVPPPDSVVLVSTPESRLHWTGVVREVGTEGSDRFIIVEFPSERPLAAADASILVEPAAGGNDFSEWQIAAEIHPVAENGASQAMDFTYQDRKGNQWVYRGPHSPSTRPALFMQFYYKTLPGFFFPGIAADAQPAIGTITPYLRPQLPDGSFFGDAVRGNANNPQESDGNSLGITYLPAWPEGTPVLEMAETLTVPKRGLPGIRGNTSLEILYQQSQVADPNAKSVVLHDPTREKEFDLGDDPESNSTLGAIPASVATTLYRGKTYFPQLPPHLVDRFFLDPNRGEHGALVFHGEFVEAQLGESYLHLNVLGSADMNALKSLCDSTDPKRAAWNSAIENLETQMQLFVEDTGKPGTYKPGDSVAVAATTVAEVTDDDVAVDSYALTATGPGTGYVTLIAGNGRAFTPEADPVSIHIIRVVNTLYRGEVNVVESSNPLNEKLTLQQVVDLAGLADHFSFEWKIAAPVDGLPPTVYQNTAQTLLTDGPWSHLRFPLPADYIGNVQSTPTDRLATDVLSTVTAVSLVPFNTVTKEVNRYQFSVNPPHHLATGNHVIMRTENGSEIWGKVHGSTTASTVIVEEDGDSLVNPSAAEIIQLYERTSADRSQSMVFREFDVPAGTYSQVWLSLDLDDSLGAQVYLDGQLVVQANTGTADTATSSAPNSLNPLPRAYLLPPAVLASGITNPDRSKTHRIAVNLFSSAIAGSQQAFNVRLEAFSSIDVTAAQWLPLDPERYEDGLRAVLGGTADVRSLSDNYLIMRYQANTNTHASWVSNRSGGNINWSQWTQPQLAEGWIKRVLKGINPFNQRMTDLFNNQVNTDVSIVAQAGPRWEGNVALNLETINDAGLIEIYETVLNRGRMLSIDAGINYGPANDALLLAAGYLNDLYMILGNEAWADAANPTIGIGTKDNTYGDIATALFAFRGQLPSLLEEELAMLRGRDDFLLPGVELRPLYNRLPWNFTRGIDAGEVIYSLNYNILDQNTDGVVDAADAQTLFPQGHGDAYGHYLTAVKGYYSLLLNPNFDWVPRIEAVTVLGKPVSVDYQDERKFAAAAAALARAGKQTFDLTWRRDYEAGLHDGWEHFSATKENSTTRNIPTTRYWGADYWASRAGQGAYLNWIVGNAMLPDEDPDPAHEGSIQQVDRTTVLELKELPTIADSLQTALDNAEGGLTPLGLPSNTIPFDLNPLSILNGENTAHFEQIYERARDALNNAVAAFDDAKDVTRLMRSEQDSVEEFQTEVQKQEAAYNNSLIELYGSPYPEDMRPGGSYAAGYTGPDLIHYMYVDNKELTFPGLLEPQQDVEWFVDIQTFTPDWLDVSRGPFLDFIFGTVDGVSDFSFIQKARTSRVDGEEISEEYTGDGNLYVHYNLSSHGFFEKPDTWSGKRATPGRIQQSISDIIKKRNAAFEAFYKADSAKADLDWAIIEFDRKKTSHASIRNSKQLMYTLENTLAAYKLAFETGDKILEETKDQVKGIALAISESIPKSIIAGVAAGGDIAAPARAAVEITSTTTESVTEWARVVNFLIIKTLEAGNEFQKRAIEFNQIAPEEWNQQLRDSTSAIRDKVDGVNNELMAINNALQELDDAYRSYQGLLAEGDRIQSEREVFRQRAAAVIQGYRTRDAAFRIFRNEKLERYKTLFDLAARYTYMAAQAFDYDTGLLHTPEGKEFINRIIRSRALGVVQDGEPQFAGSNIGDPGLSSVMAEMKADWSVLRGRLGIKNPDAYGTTASLRSEHFRILPGSEGDMNWQDRLNAGRKANILDDSDVRRYCMQITSQNGLPVPGIVLEFSTTIADGLNLFGRPLAPGDHSFSSASYATKIFGVGVALEGYKGMDDPVANGSAINAANGASPADPSLVFLDPEAMAANPYIYLIPVGLDSMRSPPLGDVSVIRTWNVDDVAIPLPFNIGASGFSTAQLWQSSDSLTEPPFTTRKHQPFRPVSSAAVFGTLVVYGGGSELERSQYNNTRLIGRSIWNSKWKLVIPGRTLLNDPNDGLDRFVRSVKDVKLYFMTYSYAGN